MSLTLLPLATKKVNNDMVRNEEEYVEDLIHVNNETGEIRLGGGLSFLTAIAEYEQVCEPSDLVRGYVEIANNFAKTLVGMEFGLKESFDKFLSTLRRSVRLAYKKHAVSLFAQKFQRDMKKANFSKNPDEREFISFLEETLKDYKIKSRSKRAQIVFAVGLLIVKNAFQKLEYNSSGEIDSMFDDAKNYINTHQEELKCYEKEQEGKDIKKRIAGYQRSSIVSVQNSANDDESAAEKIGTWVGYAIALLLFFAVVKCTFSPNYSCRP